MIHEPNVVRGLRGFFIGYKKGGEKMVVNASSRSREAPRWQNSEEPLVQLSADRLFRILLAINAAFPEINPSDLDTATIGLFEDLGFAIPDRNIAKVIEMIRSGDKDKALLMFKTDGANNQA